MRPLAGTPAPHCRVVRIAAAHRAGQMRMHQRAWCIRTEGADRGNARYQLLPFAPPFSPRAPFVSAVPTMPRSRAHTIASPRLCTSSFA